MAACSARLLSQTSAFEDPYLAKVWVGATTATLSSFLRQALSPLADSTAQVNPPVKHADSAPVEVDRGDSPLQECLALLGSLSSSARKPAETSVGNIAENPAAPDAARLAAVVKTLAKSLARPIGQGQKPTPEHKGKKRKAVAAAGSDDGVDDGGNRSPAGAAVSAAALGRATWLLRRTSRLPARFLRGSAAADMTRTAVAAHLCLLAGLRTHLDDSPR